MLEKKLIKKYWWAILSGNILAVILGLISTVLFTILGPSIQIYIKPHADGSVLLSSLLGDYYSQLIKYWFHIETLPNKTLISALPVVIFILALIRGLLTISQWYLWELVSERVVKDIRRSIVEMVIHTKLDSESKGELESNVAGAISYDCRKTKDFFVRFYGGFPREASQCLFYSTSLYFLSPELFSVFFVALLPAVAVLGVLGRKIRKKSKKLMVNYSQMSEWLQQRLLGIETIKAFKSEEDEIKSFELISSNNYRNFLRILSTTAKTSPVLEFIAVIAMVMVLYVSLIQVEAGVVTGAVVLSFFSVVASLSQSASKLGKYFNASREGRVAIGRIEKLFESISYQVKDYRLYVKSDNLISLKNVSVSYGEEDFFSGLSLDIKRGKSYCLVGPSGAGKSTLISLMLGVLKANKGSVEVDLDLKDLGKMITVPQKLLLSPDGLEENISFPLPPEKGDLIRESLSELFEAKELEKLYSVEDIDVNLSGGQEQRLLLSRLFYHKPSLSIIDEGTSALDKNNESKFYNAFSRLKSENSSSSSIIIAHRPMALEFCDEVIHIDSGKLEFLGSVSEYKKSSLFKKTFT